MSISDLFAYLGAPLVNKRWSWGAIRSVDGAVVLRVWQDLKFIDGEGIINYLVCTPNDDEALPLGYQERVRHTEAIRGGAPCFMIMCVAEDVETPKRVIGDYDDRDIRLGGDVIETGPGFQFPPNTSGRTKSLAQYGATWVRVAGRKSVDDVRA